jgi:hypothetical protein
MPIWKALHKFTGARRVAVNYLINFWFS